MAKYRFSFDTDGVYGRIVHLVVQWASPESCVLDLGCGYGAVAEPLSERGWKYVGFDVDAEAVADLRNRGFGAHTLDLAAPDLVQQVLQCTGDRRIGAVLLLDVVEHMSDFRALLEKVRIIAEKHQCPAVLSVPNVAHLDIGAKLLCGRWDVTPTGLLDETHLNMFTDKRLTRRMEDLGWREVDRDDYLLAVSDQNSHPDNPALAGGTPLRMFLEWVRGQADPFGFVNQFVRVYLPGPPVERTASPPGPFLSVLLRTQGLRPTNLREALTCLGGQSATDFECLLLVHSSDPQAHAEALGIAADFTGIVGSSLRVIPVEGGGRARPLNAGLNEARGRYVSFLDDDDHVTGEWVESFRKGAESKPGSTIRCWTFERQIRPAEGLWGGVDHQAHGWPRLSYQEPFSLVRHFRDNRTPICGFAIPMESVRAFRLRFNEALPVVEDWDFLLRAASVTGVHDTEEATSIYHRWQEGASSALIPPRTWAEARDLVLAEWDRHPVLLPAGSVSTIVELVGTERALADAQRETKRLKERTKRLEQSLQKILDSRTWRATARVRRARRVGRDILRAWRKRAARL